MKNKLIEITVAKKKVDAIHEDLTKAVGEFADIATQVYGKACEIINNINDIAGIYEKIYSECISSITWISREKVRVEYRWKNGKEDFAEFPPRYFFMGEWNYRSEIEQKKEAEEKANGKAERELYLKLKAKYEQKPRKRHSK